MSSWAWLLGLWGAHAPSRADFGAIVEIFLLRCKFAIARARSPAREARALPRFDVAAPLRHSRGSRPPNCHA